MDDLLKEISQDPDVIDGFDADKVTAARQALREFTEAVKAGELEADDDTLDEAKALSVRLKEREAAIEEASAKRAEKLSELETELGIEEPDTEEPDEEPAEAEAAEPEATEAEEPVEEPEKVAVAASAEKPKLGQVAKRIPTERKPRPDVPAMVASADGHYGERVETPERLAELFIDRHRSLGSQKPSQGSAEYPVAQFTYETPWRVSSDMAPEAVGKVFEQAAARFRAESTPDPESLTASLAFCAPAQPIYTQFGNISADGLVTVPTVTASRGQITYPTSVSFQDLTGQAGIGSEWTGSGSKSTYTFSCPETVTCEVVANVTIIEVNNAQSRFYPEAVADLNSKAMGTARHDVNARQIVDVYGNAKSVAYAAENTGAGGLVNLTKNLRFHTDQYRERYRLARTATLDLVVPWWVTGALFADAFARDSTNTYTGVEGQLASIFAQMNLRPQYVYDWHGINDEGGGTYPVTTEVMFWEPGTVVRLDSGTLDLGVVRDSTLNATNDYQTFVETFEGMCVPGHEVAILQELHLCPTGGTGNRVTIPCTPASS